MRSHPAHKVSRAIHPRERVALPIHPAAPNAGHEAFGAMGGSPIAGISKPDNSVPSAHLPQAPAPVPEAPVGMASGPAGY